jgi:hypothetical protein
MTRYEVIESKAWKHDDGRTASLYGAVPWTSSSEEKRWKIVPRGYTVRDNVQGTVGIGRQPWQTRAEAQAWVDKENARLDELAAARGRSTKTSVRHAKKKSPAQLDREIAEALAQDREDFRVVVYGEPGAKPLHVSRWMTKTQAEHAQRNHRAMNKERGHEDYEVIIEPRWMVEERGRYAR